jgi:hypothetical protein
MPRLRVARHLLGFCRTKGDDIMQRFSRNALVVVATVVVAAAANRVSGGDAAPTSFVVRSVVIVKDLNATFTAAGSTFRGSGNINTFGHVTETGKLFVTPMPHTARDAAHGSIAVTLNGGDQLFINYTGEVTRGGALTGSVAITGGTGRFANASGSGGISAQINTARNFNAPMRMTIIGTIQ